MEETNFALIVVGIVAIVGIVGILNFNSITGKALTAQTSESIILDDGTLAWCTEKTCEATNGGQCQFTPTSIGKGCGVYETATGETYSGFWKP